MIKKRLKKMIIALLCVALGISTLTPMDDTNAATIVYTRKKTYILSDSEKIKRFTCNAIKRNYNPAIKKVSVTFTDEGKYTIKYVTGKNKKKTCVVYIDSKKPVISGVKNGEDYESKVNIKVSDKVSGVASVTLNGKKMSNKFTVSEAGDYKLVAKDKCNNKTVVNFSVIEDEPEETPDVVTAEPNPEDFETPSPEPTEDPNGGTVVIGGTSTPVATSATTTDAPKGTATPNVKTTASPAPTAKQTDKPGNATSTPKVTATPTVAPTEVPKKTYEVKVQVPQAWSSSTVYLYSYYLDSNDVKVEPNGTWANATVMTRDNSLSGYWYSANITLPQGQTAYVLVKNSNGQQRPEAQSQGYAVSGNTWVDLYGSVSSSKPSVVPTEVPATPTPAPATPLPEHCGTESELANWNYTKIEAKKGNTIVLNSYDGSSTSITVRAKYCINGTIYNTDFRSTSNYTSGGANDSLGKPTFYDNQVLKTVTIDGEIDATSGVWLFGKCSQLRSVNGLSNIHTKDCSYMFRECRALDYIDGIPTGAEICTEMFMLTDFSLSGLNITIPNTVTECMRMFSASNISKISGYIGSNVNNAAYMFMNCDNLTDSSRFEVHAKDCTYMFYRCLKMSTRPILGSEITKDDGMFNQCA